MADTDVQELSIPDQWKAAPLTLTPEEEDAAARLETLEVLLAHQERVIAELNDVITTHWRRPA